VAVGEERESGAHRAVSCPARRYLYDGGCVLTADGSGENRAWLRARFPGRPIHIASAPEVEAAILSAHGATLRQEAVEGLARRMPELSARRVVTPGQARLLLGACLFLPAGLLLWPHMLLQGLTLFLALLFVLSGLFRVLLAWVGAGRPNRAYAVPRHGLPTYTILVPLYREAVVVPHLARALASLDYPRHLLDIKLVLEADDAETIAAVERWCRESGTASPASEARGGGGAGGSACRRAGASRSAQSKAAKGGGGNFEIVRVPPCKPRTKPKAANYALQFARGEYLVIYDAEDRPEPDQLLKAVAAFRAGPRQLACVQARLNFYNADHNWLTRMFALDYALWFDMLLPGLDRLGVPMPLGGTSNHFRTQVLRDIGGWDSFNVTEDADIGIRLSQLGYRVSMIDSTTFEEAPVTLRAWLGQRSRWLKGYMQTWLVHMRDPLRLLKQAGLRGFLAFQLFLGGGIVFALVNPLLWVFFLGTLLLGGGAGWTPGLGLLANNLVLTLLAMLSPLRSGRGDLSPYGLTVIFYWALVSVAGYWAFKQLFTRPHHWEKTAHGIVPPP